MNDLEQLKKSLQELKDTEKKHKVQSKKLLKEAIGYFKEMCPTDVIFFNANHNSEDDSVHDLYAVYEPDDYTKVDVRIAKMVLGKDMPVSFDVRSFDDWELGCEGRYFYDADSDDIEYDIDKMIAAILRQVEDGLYFDLEGNVGSALALYHKKTGMSVFYPEKDDIIAGDLAVAEIDFNTHDYSIDEVVAVNGEGERVTILDYDFNADEYAEEICSSVRKYIENLK